MDTKTNGHTQVTPNRIFGYAWGYTAPLIIDAAVRHHIFDAVDSGARTVKDIARIAETSERGTRAVLNALVGFGLVQKREDQYTLETDATEFLVTRKPAFMGRFFNHIPRNVLPVWTQLSEAVQTGKPVKSLDTEKQGAEFFENFVTDLFPMNYAPASSLAKTMNVAEAKTPVSVLDLAAGSGVWGIAMAQASPEVRVTAVDWEGVIPVTKKVVEKLGVKNQFAYVSGDLADANFGRGHDIAILGHILHSEGKTKSRALLKRTFDALAPGGTVAIAEWLVQNDRTAPLPSLVFAVNMLLMSEEGDTFSFEEIRSWLEDAGFEDVRMVDSPGISPLVLATKPK